MGAGGGGDRYHRHRYGEQRRRRQATPVKRMTATWRFASSGSTIRASRAYPGEHLRLGRQRLREDSGEWMDTNIEALNWTFETTLLRSHLGAAQRFSDYRTDLD